MVMAVCTVLGLVVLDRGYSSYGYSAICPKCLQHAYMTEKDVYGLLIWRSIRLLQSPGGLMSVATFSPPIPRVSPVLYRKICGESCRHGFKKGSFGGGRGFLAPAQEDGGCRGWLAYRPRINAIEALYATYGRVQDRDLARGTYTLIDHTWPLNPDREGLYALCWQFLSDRVPDELLVKAVENYRGRETEPVLQAGLRLRRITAGLKAVKSAAQWQEVLAELDKPSP
jgi:hypothetical protein